MRENTISEANVAIGDSALASYNGLDPGIDGFNTALGSIALTALTDDLQEHWRLARERGVTLTGGDNNTAVGWRSVIALLRAITIPCLGEQRAGHRKRRQ